MQPDPKSPQQHSTIAVKTDIEAPLPNQNGYQPSSATASDLPHVISTEDQHFTCFGHLNPRRQVYFDEEAHGYVIKHSRAHRKNRFAEFLPDEKHWEHLIVVPKWPQFLRLDFGNISWYVAVFFTLGSVAWIVNGQYAMWPAQGDSSLENNIHWTGYSALVGGLLFWVGAYLSIVEALNEKEHMNFGIELRHVLDTLEEEPRDIQRFVKNKRTDIKNKKTTAAISGGGANGVDKGVPGQEGHHGACHLNYIDISNNKKKSMAAGSMNGSSGGKTRHWRWWGTETSSLGWWAAIIQYTGATAFTVSVITGTPGVLSSSQWQVQTALIWTMQVIGSLCFFISSTMLLLEEQRKWYLPALDRIGWHSAFWNIIGSLGFFFSAVFGYLADWGGRGEVCCQFWGTAFNTYYGSWAFLISSVLMLIEVENKEPTRFDHLVARAMAWVAIKTRFDSEELEEEEEEEETSRKSNQKDEAREQVVAMGDRKVCY